MSGYKNFAIWGAGNIGARIATSLLELQPQGTVSSVLILTRAESKDNDANKKLAANGAKIVPFDVQGADAASALAGVDVLISTVGHTGLDLQDALLQSAHSAGVKLFVPAEWGDWTDGRPEPMFKRKSGVRAKAAELGVTTAAFFHGLWTEWIPMIGYDLKAGKITINGPGTEPISTTSIADVARFVVHVLVRLPRSQLENAKFQFEGDRFIPNDLVAALQKVSSKPLEIVHVPRTELQKRVDANASDSFAAVVLGWVDGKGALPGPLSNDLWPEWKPKKAMEILTPLAAA